MTTSISIVTAHLGDVAIALAADAVVRLDDDQLQVPHMGDLLWSGGDAPRSRAGRALTLAAHDGRSISLRVDEPVSFGDIGAGDLLAVPAVLPAESLPFVIGFARLAGELVLVLHGPRIAAAALAAADLAATTAEENP